MQFSQIIVNYRTLNVGKEL
uniref:Uncharacterized protein n=1 Tax=Anguilla anguilla TaxID=7936 RepID=A0A0E9TLT5_ANGAN